MKRYLKLLESVSLFKDVEAQDLEGLLSCLSARLTRFEKNQIVFMSGDIIHTLGVVLSGQVQVYQEDYFGNKSILAQIDPGNPFAESFACAEGLALAVSVAATAESDLLFIDCRRLSSPCCNACDFHSRVIHNLLNIVALKNIALTQKIEFTSRRTTRAKLLAYLSAEAKKAGSGHFTIPFNRQELADYLSVERSAMSAALSRLRDDGILNFHKNQFTLLG